MSQAGSKMARGFAALGEGLAEAKKNKEEAQGLDMAGQMLAKAFVSSDLPLPENWQKYSAMSAGAKKSFLGEAWKTLAVTTQQKEASNQQKDREQRMVLAQAAGARDAAAEGRLAGADAARQRFSQAMGRGVPETMSSPFTTPGGMLDRSGAFPPIRYNRNLTGPETLNASAVAGESPDDQYRRAMALRAAMQQEGQGWSLQPGQSLPLPGGRVGVATTPGSVSVYNPAETGQSDYQKPKYPPGATWKIVQGVIEVRDKDGNVVDLQRPPTPGMFEQISNFTDRQPGGQAGGTPTSPGATAPALPADRAQWKAGQRYLTNKGELMWDGTRFIQ
jgi:hypothetical protein